MTPLFEVAGNYRAMLDGIMDCDEISPEMIEAIHMAEGDLKEKAVNVAAFIMNLEAEAEGIQKAMAAMHDRWERAFNKAESLRSYLMHNLRECGMEEVKSPFFDIRLRLNPPAVAIQDESAIPDGYWRETSTRRVDKALIARDLKSNIPIPGVSLARQVTLEIR